MLFQLPCPGEADMNRFTRFLLVSAGVVGGVLFARGPLPEADAAVPTRSTSTHIPHHTTAPRHMHQHHVPHTVHIHRTRYLPTYVTRVHFYRQYKSNRLSGRKSYVV